MAKKKRGPGRPLSENPASTAICLRMTPKQKASYIETAESSGKETATWIKSELDKAVNRRIKR